MFNCKAVYFLLLRVRYVPKVAKEEYMTTRYNIPVSHQQCECLITNSPNVISGIRMTSSVSCQGNRAKIWFEKNRFLKVYKSLKTSKVKIVGFYQGRSQEFDLGGYKC